MNRRAVGLSFIIASSVFVSGNLISNSIIMSGIEDYELLKRVNDEFTTNIGIILGIICFIIGVVFFVMSEISKSKTK